MSQSLMSRKVMVQKFISKKQHKTSSGHCMYTENFSDGESVMFWRCLTSKRVGKLVFLEQTVNQEPYKYILISKLKESAKIDNLKTFTVR